LLRLWVPTSEQVTITQSGGTTFANTVGAATVAITDTADAATVAFQGNLTVGTAMTVAGSALQRFDHGPNEHDCGNNDVQQHRHADPG
jgi:hypothetical protein